MCLALVSGFFSLLLKTAMFLVMAVYVTPGPAFQHLLQVSNCDAYSSSYEVMKQCVRIWLLLNRLPFFEVG